MKSGGQKDTCVAREAMGREPDQGSMSEIKGGSWLQRLDTVSQALLV